MWRFLFLFCVVGFLPSGFFFITHYRYSESRNGNAFPLFSFAVARWRCWLFFGRNHDLSWLASWISTVFVVVAAIVVVVVVCATAAVVLSPWTEKIIMFVENLKKLVSGLLYYQLNLNDLFLKLSEPKKITTAAVVLLPWTKKWDNFLKIEWIMVHINIL